MLTRKDGKNTDWANLSLFDLAEGNATDTFFTFKIYELLDEQVAKIGLTKLYETLISPLTTEFAEIEREGLAIDTELLPIIGKQLEELIGRKNLELRAIPEVKDYNLGSPAQKAAILFTDEAGFALYPPMRSKKTDAPSTNAACLDELILQIEEELESRGKKK